MTVCLAQMVHAFGNFVSETAMVEVEVPYVLRLAADQERYILHNCRSPEKLECHNDPRAGGVI